MNLGMSVASTKPNFSETPSPKRPSKSFKWSGLNPSNPHAELLENLSLLLASPPELLQGLGVNRCLLHWTKSGDCRLFLTKHGKCFGSLVDDDVLASQNRHGVRSVPVINPQCVAPA